VPFLNKMMVEFMDVCRFVFVYIEEAHATDEWPISSGRYNKDNVAVSYAQPKTLEERARIAAEFKENMQCEIPIWLDSMSNEFEHLYACWPLRFYLVQPEEDNVKILKRFDPSEATFDLIEIREVIETFCGPAAGAEANGSV
jgi:hypothetical protein